MQDSSTSTQLCPAARLLIVDGHSYAYRAFFAIRRLSSPSGQATNAIYGFIRMLGKIQAWLRPSHQLVIWDGGLARERQLLLPDYKAQRAEMPAELRPQLDQILSWLQAARIYSFSRSEAEADDCIAAVTRQAVQAGWSVVIASSDKDFMQLVSPQVQLLNPNDRAEKLWDSEMVKNKTGVEPGQIVDWLSLVGDAVDNIPGVAGIGPKTAADLLQRFGSITELYRRLPEVASGRLRASLAEAAELVLRNQKLVRLNVDVACQLPLSELESRREDVESLRRLYSAWGFRTLLQELDNSEQKSQDLFENT